MPIKSWRISGLGDKAIIVHGGAGTWSRIRDVITLYRVLETVEVSARTGYSKLEEGDLVGAVVESISVMEDSGLFNAGLGSVLTYDGILEMDAGIMTGDYRGAGVGAVHYPRNPIRLAAIILEELGHALLVGEAADKLAEKLGLEKHPGPTEYSRTRWREALKRLKEGKGPSWARKILEFYEQETVGAAVVMGRKAAGGASTGGIVLKHKGRVGDSAIPGAGFYAVDGIGSCSATGIGETIILGRPCIHAVELIAEGVPVEEAARTAVSRHTRIFGPNTVGVIVISCGGEAAAAINTEAMPIAVASEKSIVSLFLGL